MKECVCVCVCMCNTCIYFWSVHLEDLPWSSDTLIVMSKPIAQIVASKCHCTLKETSTLWRDDWLQLGSGNIQDRPRILYFLRHQEIKEVFKEWWRKVAGQTRDNLGQQKKIITGKDQDSGVEEFWVYFLPQTYQATITYRAPLSENDLWLTK